MKVKVNMGNSGFTEEKYIGLGMRYASVITKAMEYVNRNTFLIKSLDVFPERDDVDNFIIEVPVVGTDKIYFVKGQLTLSGDVYMISRTYTNTEDYKDSKCESHSLITFSDMIEKLANQNLNPEEE